MVAGWGNHIKHRTNLIYKGFFTVIKKKINNHTKQINSMNKQFHKKCTNGKKTIKTFN